MAWYDYLIIILVGVVAGFINTLAGSGSLITIPMLIFMGLPANIANATNRIGVLLQSAVATQSFHQKGLLDGRGGLILAIPAIVGSIIGAQIALNLNEELMRRTIGVVMIVMLVIILFEPDRWLQGRHLTLQHAPTLWQILVFFAVGLYGGFIQAGVGIFILAGLVLSAGYDVVRANAIKSLIVVALTLPALLIFIYNHQVWWGIGLTMAIGNTIGGWVAVRVAVNRGAEFVRYLLIAVIIVSAAQLLGLFEGMGGWFR